MGVMDIVHGVLDVAGFIPVVGAVADVANAVIYAAEGDWGCAALSLVAAVPGIGDAAAVGGMALKVGMKAARATKAAKAAKTVKAAKSAGALSKFKSIGSFLKKAAGKAKTGAKKVKEKISKLTDFIKQKLKNKRGCKGKGSCFTGDMLVCTKRGFCFMQDIQKGDALYSRNAQTGETGFRKVCNAVQSTAHTIYHIWLDGAEEIKTTAYHRFFRKDKGWVNAIGLTEGTLLETPTGTVQVTRIFKVRHEEPVEVYNFQVEEWESYFVSGMRVYVHNGGCTGDGYKKPVSGSGKQKATDVPTWAKGNRPKTSENGRDFARRLCDEQFGKGKYPTGPGSDFNKIKKWGDRGFK